MKTNLAFLLLLFSIFFGYGQDLKMCGYQGYQTIEEVTSACDLQDANRSENSTEDAEEVVDSILDKVGLFRNFLIEECDNINNALAVTMPLDGGNIDRYILYDIEFFKKVSSSTGTDWGLTSILAHEVGHHLNGHTLKSGGSTHRVELQADEFSGFVLARMKCSLEDAQSAISKLLPDEASSTHPAKQDRLAAVAKGWNRGKGKIIPIKKITEEVRKEIVVKRIEKKDEKKVDNAVTDVVKRETQFQQVYKETALQIVGNYIDAIGGQEKVMKIQTLFLKYKSGERRTKNGTIDRYDTYQNSYLSPNKLYSKVNYHAWGNRSAFSLEINGKKYEKLHSNANWKFRFFDKNYKDRTSFIPEYSVLVGNTDVSYLGVISIDGIKCYEVQFAPVIDKSEKKGYVKWRVINETNYYDIDSGLLRFQEKNVYLLTDYKGKTLSFDGYGKKDIGLDEFITNANDIIYSNYSFTTFSNYGLVNGVLFPFKKNTKQRQKTIEIGNDKRGQLKKNKKDEFEIVEEYDEIKINPSLDKKDFRVKE